MAIALPVVVGGVLLIGAGYYASKAMAPTLNKMYMSAAQAWKDAQREKRIAEKAKACATCCPPCKPDPAGTKYYEIHRVGPGLPGKPHKPFPGDHVHFFRMDQNPETCVCSLTRNSEPPQEVPQGTTPSYPGYKPLPPGIGGGVD